MEKVATVGLLKNPGHTPIRVARAFQPVMSAWKGRPTRWAAGDQTTSRRGLGFSTAPLSLVFHVLRDGANVLGGQRVFFLVGQVLDHERGVWVELAELP